MDTVVVRKAIAADLPELLKFEQGVIHAERPFDSTLAPDPIHYYDIGAMLTAPDLCLQVAETGGAVVGSGYARIEPAKPYLRHSRYAYLGFMYVLPEFRGQGINKLILDALVAWAVGRGINEIRLDVYNLNAPAIRAYEKAGFVAHMLEMRKGS